jgi:hypothetical protein
MSATLAGGNVDSDYAANYVKLQGEVGASELPPPLIHSSHIRPATPTHSRSHSPSLSPPTAPCSMERNRGARVGKIFKGLGQFAHTSSSSR